MKLEGSRVRYSPSEKKAFEIIVKTNAANPMNTVEFVDKLYGKARRPYNARQTALGVVISLLKKSQYNQEKFVIKRSERKGPYPVRFWVERRSRAS